MTLTQAKECIKELDRRGFEKLLAQYDKDIITAALNCDIPPDDIEEAYSGQFGSDVEFVQDLLDDLPELPSYIHIDWERKARDIMMDYSEDNGYYFRNF